MKDIFDSIRSVHDLLMWHDAVFVDLAYLVILNRQPDDSGRQYYLERVRGGTSRIAILDQMSKSSEARPMWEKISDLRETLQSYRKKRKSPLWWIIWNHDPVIGASGRAKNNRIKTNTAGRAQQEIISRAQQPGVNGGTSIDRAELDKLLLQILSGGDGARLAEASAQSAEWHTPRIRSMYDIREMDMPESGRNIMNTLRA